MQTPPRIFTWLLFLGLPLLACDPAPVNPRTADELTDYLLEEMDAQHIPALSALIFREGTVLYEQHLGQSNREANLPLAADHLFLLASVSKVVTATALLQLAEEGLLELDDPINEHLPFTVRHPDYATPLTVRQLLTHTSGIADGPALDDQYYYGEDPAISLAYFLENYLVPGGEYYDDLDNFHDFGPGEEHEYSNVGSALVGLLVEEVSGQDFSDYCQEHIFAPLGMEHTYWRLEPITETIVTPYRYANRQYEAIPHYTFTDYPNGGLRSTARDLHQFLQAFVQAGQSNGVQLLEAATLTQMMTPQIPSLDETVGLHLFLMDPALGLWGHDGGEEGVATIMAFHPTTHVGVILLANQGDADLESLLSVAYTLGETL